MDLHVNLLLCWFIQGSIVYPNNNTPFSASLVIKNILLCLFLSIRTVPRVGKYQYSTTSIHVHECIHEEFLNEYVLIYVCLFVFIYIISKNTGLGHLFELLRVHNCTCTDKMYNLNLRNNIHCIYPHTQTEENIPTQRCTQSAHNSFATTCRYGC